MRCIALAADVMNDLDDVWRQRSLSAHTKFCLYSACVLTALLYGCETWTLNKHMWAKVQAFHMRCQHRILSVKWNDFLPNVTVATTSGLDCIIYIARARRLGLFGHIARCSRDVPASTILSVCCSSRDGYTPDPSWRCSSEGPRTIWLDQISCDTGMSQTDALYESLAQGLSQWRAVAMVAKAVRIWLTDWVWSPWKMHGYCLSYWLCACMSYQNILGC